MTQILAMKETDGKAASLQRSGVLAFSDAGLNPRIHDAADSRSGFSLHILQGRRKERN